MLQYQHRVLNMKRRTVEKRRPSLTFDFVIGYQIMFTYSQIIFLLNFLAIYFKQFSYKWLVIRGRHSISRYQGYLYDSYILYNEILHDC